MDSVILLVECGNVGFAASHRYVCSCFWLELTCSSDLGVSHAHRASLRKLVVNASRRRGRMTCSVDPKFCRGYGSLVEAYEEAL